MTTPARSTPKSSRTRRKRPRPRSGTERTPTTSRWESRSNGFSATTDPATDPRYSTPPSATSSTNTPAPTGRKPTAKLNGSTAPSHSNGLTPTTTAQTQPEPPPTTRGSTATITTDPIPASAANHPSTAYTTSMGRTPRTPRTLQRMGSKPSFANAVASKNCGAPASIPRNSRGRRASHPWSPSRCPCPISSASPTAGSTCSSCPMCSLSGPTGTLRRGSHGSKKST